MQLLSGEYPISLQPLDSPKRDFENKILLASHLASHGIASVIGTTSFIQNIHCRSQNALWLGRLPTNDGRTIGDQKVRRAMQERHTHLFFLHDEGGFYLRGHFQNSVKRIHPKELSDESQTQRIYFWGRRQEAIYRSISDKIRNDVLLTVGAPRFDLASARYQALDTGMVDKLKKHHGEYLLFCSRFSAFNNGASDPDPLGQRTIELASYNAESNRQVFDYVYDQWRKTGEDFLGFVKLVQTASFAFPCHKIVVRPHPSEEVRFYEDAFDRFPNVQVIGTGDVRPWLRGAKVVIQSECTTGFEAILSGTPTVNFVPCKERYPEFLVEGLHSMGAVAATLDEALQAIEAAISGASVNDISCDLSDIINNVNELATPLITDDIARVCRNNGTATTIGNSKISRSLLRRVVAPMIKMAKGSRQRKEDRSSVKSVSLKSFDSEMLLDRIKQIDQTSGNIASIGKDHVVVTP